MDDEKVKLHAYSEEGDRDWYGDFNYGDNPLDHYHNSKVCTVKRYGGSSHGFGTAEIEVETTMGFIKMMGWEDDLKYRVND